MSSDHEALSSRAIACPGWRWMPGMPEGELPDLSDPATLGCLLALVREAWDDPQVHAAPMCAMGRHVGWRVWFDAYLTVYFDGDTEAEALVCALEAAPVRAEGER